MDKHPIVSSNTLFHFTNKREHLLDILKNNFRARYCLETLGDLFPNQANPDLVDQVVPMVCFCDLPLSNTSKHLSTYGNYGIGLTKDWGKKNGLSPILYIHKESALWLRYMDVCTNVAENPDKFDDSDPFVNNLGLTFAQILCFLKVYQGRFFRHDKIIENVRFYDEREWRYVPLNLDFQHLFLKRQDFFNIDKRNEANSFLFENAQLKFTPDDIRYIVVENEEEILQTMDDIMNLKGEHYAYNQVKLLQSRIISAEQIREDF